MPFMTYLKFSYNFWLPFKRRIFVFREGPTASNAKYGKKDS